MVKQRMAYALSALVMMFGMAVSLVASPVVYAGDGEATIITTADELNDALWFGGNYKLGADINTGDCQYGSPLFVRLDTVLDLDNYTITLPDAQASINGYGASLTIKGDKGKIVKAVEDTDYPTIYVNNGDMTLEGGNIEGKKFSVIVTEGNSFTMTGGSLTADQFGIANHGNVTIDGGTIISNQSGVAGYDLSETTINGGTIDAKHIAVHGNGTHSGTKFNINGGTINGNLGVYLPQVDGLTTITGGTINAKNGVEVRAGELNITGGTINVPSNVEYSVDPNGSGATTLGSAISVAQHTTRNPISVNVSGGVFTAPVAFSQADPQDGDAVDVAISITGGEFNAINDDSVIISDGIEEFVYGGVYNERVEAKYIADGYGIGLNNEDRWQVVNLAELDAAGDEIDNDDNTGEPRIYPKKVDWSQDGGYIETDFSEENQVSVTLEIGEELLADRKATLSATEVSSENLTLDATKGGELIGAVEIDMLDRDGASIEVKDKSLVIWFDIDEDTYNMLSAYDKLYAVYFENGVEVERYEITLENEGFWFETSHLSTYGVVGVNGGAEAEQNAAGTSSAATPDTGTVTVAGASAMSAAIITAVAVGLLTSIISFAYLIRKH